MIAIDFILGIVLGAFFGFLSMGFAICYFIKYIQKNK